MTTRAIHALPQDVVDRIAAGEVVQRPSSVIKELIENSLDAGSKNIDICVSWDNRSLTVKDDGCGIARDDLKLAATRFATSKLTKWHDLKEIGTFGFRGEALASASMVGRLSISSRFKQDRLAFKCDYRDGHPIEEHKNSPPVCALAGSSGTVVTLQDLFYNVPARLHALEKATNMKDEYNRILDVIQRYAVAKAQSGVGFVCRRRKRPANKKQSAGSTTTDLNTASYLTSNRNNLGGDDKTKNVIAHVFGHNLMKNLLKFVFKSGDVRAAALEALQALKQKSQNQDQSIESLDQKDENKEEKKDITDCSMMTSQIYGSISKPYDKNDSIEDNDDLLSSKSSFAYHAYGFISKIGNHDVISKTTVKTKQHGKPIFIIFINGRLVESSAIRKSVENAFILANNFEQKQQKPPFCFISLELPGPHIDVNIHPTKREVTLLFEDKICEVIGKEIYKILSSDNENDPKQKSQSQSQLFSTQNDLVNEKSTRKKTNEKNKKSSNKNKKSDEDANLTNSDEMSENEDDAEEEKEGDDDDSDNDFLLRKKRKRKLENHKRNSQKESNTDNREKDTVSSPPKEKKSRPFVSPLSSVRKSPYDPKNLVRVNSAARSGALEPYLVHTESQQSSPKKQSPQKSSFKSIQHQPDCEFYDSYNKKIDYDLSKPGAFAQLICRCQITKPPSLLTGNKDHSISAAKVVFRGNRPPIIECNYTSIQNLRNRVLAEQAPDEMTNKLRGALYVGTISRNRSLIQWNMELLMIHHTNLAKLLFYQLALNQFKGIPMACLGQSLNVKELIKFELQNTSKSESYQNEQTELLAKQAATCLARNRKMLKDYFSISFEYVGDNSQNKNDEEKLILTGLPILLEGHSPPPNELPSFLLRLAFEVNWMEEEECFHSICTELGFFYSKIPILLENFYQNCSKSTSELSSIKSVTELDNDNHAEDDLTDASKKWIQHTLFPAICILLVPPSDIVSSGTVVKLAVLSSLYKVFERC